MKPWHFSIAMAIAYLGIFHLWFSLTAALGSAAAYPFILGSSIIWALIMGAWLWRANQHGYFANRMDLGAHAVVIAEVLMEGHAPIQHDHLGFYLCCIAFAIVIGGYRAHARQNTPHDEPA